MRIYHNQLNNTLNKGLTPFWLIFGDELWQKNDSLIQVKQLAKQQGFDELIRFTADDKFDWQQVLAEYNALSLFSQQRIIEIEIVNGKVNEQGNKLLIELTNHPDPNVLMIFHGPKIDAKTTSKAWFKAMDKQGVYLPLYELDNSGTQRWLKQQCHQLGLMLAPDVDSLLIDCFEGNLPTLHQELQKLSILFPQQQISFSAVESLLINQAKFTPFQLVDALFSGALPRVITIIDQLQHDGSQLTTLLWILHKELTQLALMLQKQAEGINAAQIIQEYRIWDKRKPVFNHALATVKLTNVKRAIARLASVDLISKTTGDFDCFLLLKDVALSLYYGDTTSQYALDVI